jgi:hypothetical protein
MAYQILDAGVSIHFVWDLGELLVMKHDVKQVAVLRDDMLEIKVSGATRAIFFRYSDVTAPATDSAASLRDAINSMIATSTAAT